MHECAHACIDMCLCPCACAWGPCSWYMCLRAPIPGCMNMRVCVSVCMSVGVPVPSVGIWSRQVYLWTLDLPPLSWQVADSKSWLLTGDPDSQPSFSAESSEAWGCALFWVSSRDAVLRDAQLPSDGWEPCLLSESPNQPFQKVPSSLAVLL